MTAASAAGLLFLSLPAGRPSIEQMFVAQTRAAEEAENICLMPPEDGGARTSQAPAGQPPSQTAAAAQAARLTAAAADTSSDLPPVRMVVDPYPSFNGVFVDTTANRVLMSDTNRKSLLMYEKTAGSATAKAAETPLQQIMGPETGIGFIAGVAIDAAHHELFAVNYRLADA